MVFPTRTVGSSSAAGPDLSSSEPIRIPETSGPDPCRKAGALLQPATTLRSGRHEGVSKTGSAANSAHASRGDALRRGALLAAGFAFGAGSFAAVRPGSARAAAPTPAQDREIFNFALLLEYLQADFYADAVRHGGLKGDVRRFAEVVAEHERAHVDFLRKALGAHARSKPTFDFGEATQNERSFLKAAVLLENTGVVAYNGQAANLTKPALAAAAEIVSVEGRHAAWISALAGVPPAPRAADAGATSASVVRTLQSTHFVKTQ
jgi:rubrerythrin